MPRKVGTKMKEVNLRKRVAGAQRERGDPGVERNLFNRHPNSILGRTLSNREMMAKRRAWEREYQERHAALEMWHRDGDVAY